MTVSFIKCEAWRIIDDSVVINTNPTSFPKMPVPNLPKKQDRVVVDEEVIGESTAPPLSFPEREVREVEDPVDKFLDKPPENSDKNVYFITKAPVKRVVFYNAGLRVVPENVPEGRCRYTIPAQKISKTFKIPSYDRLKPPGKVIETYDFDVSNLVRCRDEYQPLHDDQFISLLKENSNYFVADREIGLSDTDYALEVDVDFEIYPIIACYNIHQNTKPVEVQFEYSEKEAVGNMFRDVLSKDFMDLPARGKITIENIQKGESDVTMIKKRSVQQRTIENLLTRNGEMRQLKAFEMMKSGNLDVCGDKQINQEDYFKQFKGRFDNKCSELADTKEQTDAINSMKDQYAGTVGGNLREYFPEKTEEDYHNPFENRRRYKIVDGNIVDFTPEDYAAENEKAKTIDQSIQETRDQIAKEMVEQDRLIDKMGEDVPERYKIMEELKRSFEATREREKVPDGNIYKHILASKTPAERDERMKKILAEFGAVVDHLPETEDVEEETLETMKKDEEITEDMKAGKFREIDEILKSTGKKVPLEEGEYLTQLGDFRFVSPYCDYYFDLVLDDVAFPIKLITQKLTADLINVSPILCNGDANTDGQLTYNECVRFGFPIEVTHEETTRLFGTGTIRMHGLEMDIRENGAYRCHVTRPNSVYHIRYTLHVRSAVIKSDSYVVRYDEDDEFEEVLTIPSCKYGTPARFFSLPTISNSILDKFSIENMNAMVLNGSINFAGEFGDIPVILYEPYIQEKSKAPQEGDGDPVVEKLRELADKPTREILGIPQERELFKIKKLKFKIIDKYSCWYRCMRQFKPCEFQLPIINDELAWTCEVGYFDPAGEFMPHSNSEVLAGMLNTSLDNIAPKDRELKDVRDYRVRFNPVEKGWEKILPQPYSVAKINITDNEAEFVDMNLYVYILPDFFSLPREELMMISKSQNLPAVNLRGSRLAGTSNCIKVVDPETNELSLQVSDRHITLLVELISMPQIQLEERLKKDETGAIIPDKSWTLMPPTKYTFPQEFVIEYLGQDKIHEQHVEKGDYVLAEVYYPVVNNVFAPKYHSMNFKVTKDMRVLTKTGIVDYMCHPRQEVRDFSVNFANIDAVWENAFDASIRLELADAHNLEVAINPEDNTLRLSMQNYAGRDCSYAIVTYTVHNSIRKTFRVDVLVENKEGATRGKRTIRVLDTNVHKALRGTPSIRKLPAKKINPFSSKGGPKPTNMKKHLREAMDNTGIGRLDEEEFEQGFIIEDDENVEHVDGDEDKDEENVFLGDYDTTEKRDKIIYAFSNTGLMIDLNDNNKLESKYEKVLNDPIGNGQNEYLDQENGLVSSSGENKLKTNCPTKYYYMRDSTIIIFPGHNMDEMYFAFFKMYSEIKVKFIDIKTHYWLAPGETVLHDEDILMDLDKITISNPYKFLSFSEGLNYAYLDPEVVWQKGVYSFKVKFDVNGSVRETTFEFMVQDYVELILPDDRESLEVTNNYLFNLTVLEEDPTFCVDSFPINVPHEDETWPNVITLQSDKLDQAYYVCRVVGTVACKKYKTVMTEAQLSKYTVDISPGKFIDQNIEATKTVNGNLAIFNALTFKNYKSNFFLFTKDQHCLLYVGVTYTENMIYTNDPDYYITVEDHQITFDTEEDPFVETGYLVPKHINSNTFPYKYSTADLENTRKIYRYVISSSDDLCNIENVQYHLMIDGEVIYHKERTGVLLNRCTYEEIFIEARSATVRGDHLINAKPDNTRSSSIFYYYNVEMYECEGRPRTTITFDANDPEDALIIVSYRIGSSWYTRRHVCAKFSMKVKLCGTTETISFAYNDTDYRIGSRYPPTDTLLVKYDGEHRDYLMFNKSSLGEEGITQVLSPVRTTVDVTYLDGYTQWKFRNNNMFFDIQKLVYVDEEGWVREDDFVFFNNVVKISVIENDEMSLGKFVTNELKLPATPLKIFAYDVDGDIPYRDILTSEETVDRSKFGEFFSYDEPNNQVVFDTTVVEYYEFFLVVVFQDKTIAITHISKDSYSA